MSTTTQATWPTLGELSAEDADLMATVIATIATCSRGSIPADNLLRAVQIRTPHVEVNAEDIRRLINVGVCAKLLKYSSHGETSLVACGYDVARHHGGVVGWLRDRAREGDAS